MGRVFARHDQSSRLDKGADAERLRGEREGRGTGRWQVKAASRTTIKKVDVSRGTQSTLNNTRDGRVSRPQTMEGAAWEVVASEDGKRRRRRSPR